MTLAATTLLALAARGATANPAVAYPLDFARETRETAKASPSSALEATVALRVAQTIADQISGAQILTVMPTGSMRPMFDEKALLVVEPTPFEHLQTGDVVTFLHPRLGLPIVHRIVEKHPGFFRTKGDHNFRPDDVAVTAKDYQMRVVAVIYAREDSRNVSRPIPTATLALAN